MVGERAGYDLRSLVPVYTRVLRAGYWLRPGACAPGSAGCGWPGRREPVDAAAGGPAGDHRPRRVSAFGPEIVPIVERPRRTRS